MPIIFSTRCAVGVVAAHALLLAGCTDDAPEPWKPRVIVESVTTEEYRPSSQVTGDIQARVQARQGFRVGGKIIERLVDVGDHVEHDQVLARLDPQDLRNNLVSAQAEVTARQAELQLAEVNFKRQSLLLPKGYTSQSEYDRAEAQMRASRSELQAAKATAAMAADMLGYTELRASATGLITERLLEVGQVVQATEPVFTLAEDGARDAVFNVYEGLFSKIAEGQSVTVYLVNDPTVETQGQVRELSPSVDARTGTLRIKVGLDDIPEKMTLGSVVSARIKPMTERSVVLPWSALFKKDGKPAVWLLGEGNRVRLQPVQVSRYTERNVVIADGLDEHQQVIVAGGQLLYPGQEVEVAGADSLVLSMPGEHHRHSEESP